MKEKNPAVEIQEFPLTLQDYLGELRPESRRAFAQAMQGEIGTKMRAEWQRLFARWMSKPVKVPWEVWRKG